jgi:uncharacterized protein
VGEPLLDQTAHRPWPLPNRPFVMHQTWHDLLFAHWPVPAETMRALIPAQMELDTYDGMAWVGVVPFRMSGVRPRSLPGLPWLSAFPELNVRTYVHTPAPDGAPATITRPGVYFFSLEATNPLAVAGARMAYHLPYFQAAMSLTEDTGTIHYRSKRTHKGAPPAEFAGEYGPTDGIYHSQPGSLEHWLTERYCLYTVDPNGKLIIAEIHHIPWPLQPARATITTNTMAAAAGIDLPTREPLLHFARRLDMIAWLPAPVEPLLASY